MGHTVSVTTIQILPLYCEFPQTLFTKKAVNWIWSAGLYFVGLPGDSVVKVFLVVQ